MPLFDEMMEEVEQKLSQGYFDAAIQQCHDVIKIAGNKEQLIRGLLKRGLIYGMRGNEMLSDYQFALMDLGQVIGYENTNSVACLASAAIYRKLGLHGFALEHARHVLNVINPKNEMAWLILGLNYFDIGHFDEALKCFQRALEIDPQDLLALEYAAETCAQKKYYLAAVQYFENVKNLIVDAAKKQEYQAKIAWMLLAANMAELEASGQHSMAIGQQVVRSHPFFVAPAVDQETSCARTRVYQPKDHTEMRKQLLEGTWAQQEGPESSYYDELMTDDDELASYSLYSLKNG